jgi:hypothetical protein
MNSGPSTFRHDLRNIERLLLKKKSFECPIRTTGTYPK